ncbi:hypothetical protein [Streptomyces noursei]|uniref:hypothetical protein n=1 Tax=Streptomyces noursei TaxID=1971 RepID=UPI0015E1135E|nr:hypothetical protein [Streptomyces noursei]
MDLVPSVVEGVGEPEVAAVAGAQLLEVDPGGVGGEAEAESAAVLLGWEQPGRETGVSSGTSSTTRPWPGRPLVVQLGG